MAAQFTLMNGLERRGLRLCRARAISSFPVPVSPRSRTLESVGPTVWTSARTRLNATLCPISPSKAISPALLFCMLNLLADNAFEEFNSPRMPVSSHARGIWSVPQEPMFAGDREEDHPETQGGPTPP